jgi:hypothetical protein
MAEDAMLIRRGPTDRRVTVAILATVVFGILSACGGANTTRSQGNVYPVPPASTNADGQVIAQASMVPIACPTATPLDPGPDAASAVRVTVATNLLRVYSNINTAGYQITRVYEASPGLGFGGLPFGMCGQAVGSRTWIAELYFPAELPSADLSHGQLFLTRFASGWKIWFRYH